MPTINERKISPGQLELQRRIAQAQLLHASTQDHSKDASEGKREVNMAKRVEKTAARRTRASRQSQRAQQHRTMQNFNPAVRFEDESPSYDPRRSRVADDALSVDDIQRLLGNDPSQRSYNVAHSPRRLQLEVEAPWLPRGGLGLLTNWRLPRNRRETR